MEGGRERVYIGDRLGKALKEDELARLTSRSDVWCMYSFAKEPG